MNAQQIVSNLIASRHSEDLCVPECKQGRSWKNAGGNRCRRLDLWAMKRSYTKPAIYGYEVKVSRSDFLSDEKWHEYLPLCNQLYFVTPWGLVQPEEIPEGVGLLWISKNITKSYMKKKAAHREIELPIDLFKYVLISRARIGSEISDREDVDRRAFWYHWLQERATDKDLGSRVSQAVTKHVREVERENARLRRENEELDRIKQFWTETLGCKEEELGSQYSYRSQHSDQLRAARLNGALSAEFRDILRSAEVSIRKTSETVTQFKAAIEKETGKPL